MKTLPEFFQGPIAQDFAGIADFDRSPAREAKKSPKTTPDTKNPPCSVEPRYCKADGTTPDTKNPPCSVEATLCKKKSPSTTPDTKNPPCSIEARLCKKKKKADAFLPAVEGWSMPPAPPAF
jgi:hypothetical protein